MKYESTLLTFTEVPDEISLCLNISGCPLDCAGCFEPWLKEDIGTVLDAEKMMDLIKSSPHITCVCLMGGDRYHNEIISMISTVAEKMPEMRWAMYSGKTEMNPQLAQLLDYYKIGPYNEKLGPLNKKTTNQIFCKKENNQWVDITYRFQDRKV